MKIAIAVERNDGLDSQIDPRLGRAVGLILVDSETQEFSFHDNQHNLNAAQGAGIQTAQNILDLGAEGIFARHCGPKAFRVFGSGNVAVYLGNEETVSEALDAFAAGKLALADNANVEGHWQS